jgi:predicted transcriptional regulator
MSTVFPSKPQAMTEEEAKQKLDQIIADLAIVKADTETLKTDTAALKTDVTTIKSSTDKIP